MEHRHLLPDEIDLLVDGEAGFGVAPLQAHVERCADCRAELEAARAVVQALERLPELEPSARFAEQVMSRVQVFEPWHVAAAESVRRWIPQSQAARVVALAAASVSAMVLSASALWVLVRLDMLRFFFGIALERARTVAIGAVGGLLADAFGQPVVDAISSAGPAGIAVAATAFVGSLALAALGLRALVARAGRRRA